MLCGEGTPEGKGSRGEGGKDYSREALVPWTLPIHHRARKESKRGAGGDRGGRGARPPVVLASLRALRALSPAHSGAYRNPRPDQEVARSKPRGESSPVPPPMVSHILACPQSALPWAWIHYPPPLSWRMVKEAKTHIQPQVNKPPTSCELPSLPRKAKRGRRTD